MRYLLIDFGASYIKCVEYDSETGEYFNKSSTVSPFQTKSEVTKQEITRLLNCILLEHPKIKRVVICTILGGSYIDDVYHSWKSKTAGDLRACLISGLFIDEPTFHVHRHHAKALNIERSETGLSIVGYIDDVAIYSPLGDTDCVIESINLTERDILLNMGTGSQVITKYDRVSFIPSGRAFLTFANFFKQMKIDMFDIMSTLDLRTVLESTLSVDLNVFPQSRNFTGGGHIQDILEENFTVQNLIASILKSYLTQYDVFLSEGQFDRILLAGGIPRKLPLIKEYFSMKYPEKIVALDFNPIENTHRGMASYIQKFLQ